MQSEGELLVVDDEAGVCSVLSEVLSDEGFKVTVVHNGVDAIARMYASKPRLVLLDLMLPQMDGLEVLEQMRHDRELKRIPIVAMSAAPALLQAAKTNGADEILQKPFNAGDIVSAVLKHCA